MSLLEPKTTPLKEPSGAELIDAEFLQELRGQMLKFATAQQGDPHMAEDAVQEALAGALKSKQSFARQAALKTWIFAILKNKIVDILRKKQRQPSLVELDHEGGG